MVTNWKSDIFWFSRFPTYKAKLEQLLRASGVYSLEFQREVLLARNPRFTGRAMPVSPNAGCVLHLDFSIPRLDSWNRKTITLKGPDGWVGKAKYLSTLLSRCLWNLRATKLSSTRPIGPSQSEVIITSMLETG